MTVGDLRKFLAGKRNDLPIYIHMPETVYAGSHQDSYRDIDTVRYSSGSGISSACIDLIAGKSFDY